MSPPVVEVQDPLTAQPSLRRGLFGLVLFLSCLPKLAYWLFRGDLWADEINFALNIGPRGFFEMGRPFLHLQVAPWGAMVPIKAIVSVFGESAMSYRLVPLIAAIAAVTLSYFIGRRLGGPIAGLFGMALTGLTQGMTYYAVELKPYTVDAAVSATITLLCLRVLDAPEDKRRWLQMGAAGVIGTWMSLPSLFVLGGGGIALVVDALLRRLGLRGLRRAALIGALWVSSFVVHYQLFIAKSSTVSNKNVVKYWSSGFAPFPPTTLAEFKWYPAKFFFFFDSPGGLSIRYLAGLLFVAGFVLLVRRKKLPHAIVVATPMLLAILASAMGKYATMGRLMLFAVPPMMCGIGVALVALGRVKGPATLAAATGLLLVLVVPRLDETYVKVLDPRAPKELQHVMADLGPKQRPGDLVYLAGPGLATVWEYHAPRMEKIDRHGYFGVGSLREFDADGRFPALREVAAKTFGQPRVWVVAESRSYGGDPAELGRTTEAISSFLQRFFERWGGEGRVEYEADNLTLYLFDLSAAKLPEGPEATENAAP